MVNGCNVGLKERLVGLYRFKGTGPVLHEESWFDDRDFRSAVFQDLVRYVIDLEDTLR